MSRCWLTRLAGALMMVNLAVAQLAPPIMNPGGRYLDWGDYRIEVNQYGDLGRNWPTPDEFWKGYERLKQRARVNPDPPNTLRTLLLVIPRVHATAVREVDGRKEVIGHRLSEMTSAEIKWNLEQWREFEEMVFVFSEGNAWLRTDIKVIDEPLEVETDENWEFWAGQQREWLDKYLPFERGDYQSYNCIYSSRDLGANPHGGTIGAVGGIKGCGTSDNAFYGSGRYIDERSGYVALHEWLNQQCSATSNMMPYPDGEALWNNYVIHLMGYREDTGLNPWPWISHRRDVMTRIIRPTMWRRWSALDPYRAPPVGRWRLFAGRGAEAARAITQESAAEGRLIDQKLDRHGRIRLTGSEGLDGSTLPPGTLHFRTYVESDREQEVRLWTGADERYTVWLNGVVIRDGWGWNYFDDDGALVEKAAYPTLRAGINTLVLALPNQDDKVEFRLRFCRTDGSGEPPSGVRVFPDLPPNRRPVALDEPVRHEFKQPTFFEWADVKDDPWLRLPRLDQAAMRDLTGIPSLAIKTDGSPWTAPDGTEYNPPRQHLFLEIPSAAVDSPWLAAPEENSGRLNNDLDLNWKSMAWLRLKDRPEGRDLLLVRFDVAEPLLHLLRTRGRKASESLVGWVLVEHKLAYVVLVDLELDRTPESVLDLLAQSPLTPAVSP
ncbi:MAG: hypothetical protein KJ072_10070 [Verrucomicrobia bacterium]|nr:hypothetical protein [Verrucomicrobiota bacterium]